MHKNTRPRLLPACAAAAAIGVASAAPGQPADELPRPKTGRFLRLKEPDLHRVTLRYTVLAEDHVRYRADRRGSQVRNRTEARSESWEFESASVVMPLIVETASATRFRSDLRDNVGARLEMGTLEPDTSPVIIGPYQSQSMYVRLDAPAGGADVLRAMIWQDLVCWETVLDEDLARDAAWPESWPPEADSTFQPQQYVSTGRGDRVDASPVGKLLAEWTEGKDPKSQPPLLVAKYLAGRVQEYVNPVRVGIVQEQNASKADPNPASPIGNVRTLAGFNIAWADDTAQTGEGSRHDATILLAAVYRAAGIPARVLVGIDDEQTGTNQIHSWVEFALWDAQEKQVNWIPVDVIRLRERSSRMYDLERPWMFFGTHDELDTIAPAALHFHPPTDARAFGRPALAALSMVPGAPESAFQAFDLDVSGVPRKAGDLAETRRDSVSTTP
jgi:hypothetical protein